MPFELADDIFHVIFIDQEVVFHNGPYIQAFYGAVEDLLLVMERYLGIRDKEGREEGMGNPAFLTAHTLDRKRDKNRVKLNRSCVMAITDEAAFISTGTLNHVKLQAIHQTVIINLRKIIASIKNNCYHCIVVKSTEEQSSRCSQRKGRTTLDGCDLFFFIMGFSLLSTSEFLPTEKWRCAKHKTICYAGGVVSAYSTKSPFLYNRGVQATIKRKER